MARKTSLKKVNTTGLEPAFAASPGRPPRFGFYCYKEGNNTTPNCRGYHNFYGAYAAKHFLLLLIEGDSYEWVDRVGGILNGSGETLKTSSGIIIDGLGLEEALDYEFKNDEERNWIFPHGSDLQSIRSYRLISQDKYEEMRNTPSEVETPKKDIRTKKEKKPPVDKTGLITVKEISEDLKCSPSDARSLLRKAKVEKPEAGWAWTPPEAEKIKSIIKKGLANV